MPFASAAYSGDVCAAVPMTVHGPPEAATGKHPVSGLRGIRERTGYGDAKIVEEQIAGPLQDFAGQIF